MQIIFERLGTTTMVEQETKKFNSLGKWICGINTAKNKTCGSDTLLTNSIKFCIELPKIPFINEVLDLNGWIQDKANMTQSKIYILKKENAIYGSKYHCLSLQIITGNKYL